MDWTKKEVSGRKSAAAGDYRIHASTDDLVTAYKVNPFFPLGMHPTFREAIVSCETHYKNENRNAA